MNDKSEHSNFPLPDQRDYDYAYGQAFQLASEKLKGLANLEEHCRKSGSSCQVTDCGKIITLPYLNRIYRVNLPEVAVTAVDSPPEVNLRDKILILHYILQAGGRPLSNNLISYKELKEGPIYFPSFSKRAIKPLVDHFGGSPQQLIESSKIFGAKKVNYGSIGVSIQAFVRVPIVIVLWEDDNEFSGEGNFLFDSTIPDYLSTEDINILCQSIAWQLIKGPQMPQ